MFFSELSTDISDIYVHLRSIQRVSQNFSSAAARMNSDPELSGTSAWQNAQRLTRSLCL